MTQQGTIDKAKLQQIVNASDSAKAVIDNLAHRQRIRHYSDLERFKTTLIRNGAKVIDQDYEQFWKDLEKEGYGVIVHGRNGKATRFNWHYNLKAIGEAGSTNNAAPKARRKRRTKAEMQSSDVQVASSPKAYSQGRLLYVPLQDGEFCEIKIPHEPSKDEILNIINILHNL